jgi:hypothetical protein
LRILSQSLNIYSAQLHAYILIDNHYHLEYLTPKVLLHSQRKS